MKHTFKDWFLATRPWSFPASAMPVMVTLFYLWWRGYELSWGFGIWAVLNVVVFHACGNTWSDYFDYKKGVDADDTYGNKTLTDGLFTSGLGFCSVFVALKTLRSSYSRGLTAP